MRELKSKINIVEATAPAVAKATIAGNAIDRKGFDSLTILAVIGAGAYAAAKTVTPVLTESDNGTDYTAVDAAHYDGDLSIVNDTLAANSERVIAYTGHKRYVKFGFTVAGTLDANVLLGAYAIKGHPHLMPTA